jgi:hypothetical protein
MRALKALVTIMAVIIVVGVGAVIWGIVRQASKLTEPPETSPPLQGASIVGEERNAPWATLMLNQPTGTRIATVTSAGDLVVLHLFTETPGRDERLLIIDPGTGTLLGTVTVGPR